MSSSQRADGAGPIQAARPSRRPRTLRTKLIVGIVALITVVCLAIGLVTQLFLSRYLTQQKDQQLLAAQSRSMFHDIQNQPIPGPPNVATDGYAPADGATVTAATGQDPCSSTSSSADRGRPEFLFLPGQSIGTLGARILNGTVLALGVLLTPWTCATVGSRYDGDLLAVPVDGRAHDLTIADTQYRVLATTQDDGGTLITGLPMDDVSSTQARLTIILAAVTGIALLVGGFVVFWTVRRSLRPLERVAGTARAVSELELDRGEVDLGVRVPDRDTDVRTEVGQVGAAINQMLGHVSHALQARHASETRVRRFVADASHELRTPLAAIRGYAELAGRSNDDPDAVAHALRRVESESKRMTSLVDDLLLLARLDSGPALVDEPVDLTLLALDAVSDARVAGPDHRWLLDLPEDPVTVRGDDARLHQVLGNLLANARTHTPAGTRVVTTLRTDGRTAVMTVTDDGQGIPADLQPEIFGRFVRGDSSRSRAAGSTGLGLAIVAAVAAAHRGSVTIDSRPGRTVFTVRLPFDGPTLTPTLTPAAGPLALAPVLDPRTT